MRSVSAKAVEATPKEGPAPADFLNEPIVLGPLPDCTADEATATLLVLAPGGLLPAEDFRKLATAVQEMLRERVRLTVGIMDIDWQKIVASMQNAGSKSGSMGILVGISAAATQQIIDQTGQYLDLKAGGTGRRDNVFVAGHSALGPALVRYALEQAGGLVLLASTILPEISDTFPTVSTWTRPVLNLSGELDGQQYLSRQAPAFIDAVACAAKQGLRRAAIFQPVIAIPGMNHSQFGSGKERPLIPGAPQMDIDPDISHDDAVSAAAAVVADFLAAHRGNGAAASSATGALLQQLLASSHIMGPFLEASGRGRIGAALAALTQQPDLPNPDALAAAGIIPGAVGGEALSTQVSSRKWLAHPGELAAAEAFAEDVQRLALQPLPAEVRERVIVVATAHTDESTFLYNQPTIEPLPGGQALVQTHVYLWRHFLETQERVQPGVGPEYALKTRTASAICRALGEQDLAERQTSCCISGAVLNQRTLEMALALVPAAVRQRYQTRGKKFAPVADRRVTGRTAAPDFVLKEHVTFIDVSDTETQVCAPFINTQPPGEPVPKLDSYSRGGNRFMGNHYIKVLSLARMVEWLMVDTLRPRKAPPQQPAGGPKDD